MHNISILFLFLCGEKWPILNRVSCPECLEYDAAKKREKRSNMAEDESCLKRAHENERRRERYKERKNEGVCTICGKKQRYNGTLTCIDCYFQRKRWQDEHRRRMREQRPAEDPSQKEQRLVERAKHMREVSGVSSKSRKQIDSIWKGMNARK